MALYVGNALWDAVGPDALEALLPHAPGGERGPGDALHCPPARRVQEATARYSLAEPGGVHLSLPVCLVFIAFFSFLLAGLREDVFTLCTRVIILKFEKTDL